MFDSYAYLNPKLHVVAYPEKGGGGVFARELVEAGERLMVWGGAIVNREQLENLPPALRSHSVQVEEDLYLASVIPDDPADFINHSCEPNAGLNGQIVVVAMRDIEPGEEVCFDYAMSDSSPYDEFDCQCGSPNCRKRVTGGDWTRPDLQERYKGYFSPYLQKRIQQLQPAVTAPDY